MNKQFWNVLLCGAALVLSTGTFTACGDDTDELESRVAVLEGAYADLQKDLSKALKTGSSIIKSTNDNGVWTLELSDGTTIVIDTNVKASTGGSAAGGSSVTVEQGEGSFTITVDGTAYTIPTGATVNSLVYVPEYTDGKVVIGNEPVAVKFLAKPAVSNLDNATFTIAEAHMLQTRAGNAFKVTGAAIDGEFIAVSIKALSVEPNAEYAVAVQMEMGGTVISSNYFTVQVAADFSFEAEQIGGYKIKDAYMPTEVDADGFCALTVGGLELLGNMNFKDLFDELPANAQFAVAAASDQPNAKAQEQQSLLANSLAADGAWAFAGRPGTNFQDDKQSGFLVYVTADDVIKAKIYVQIDDPLANIDFQAPLKGLCSQHLEYGTPNPDDPNGEGEGIVLNPGANKLDLVKVLLEPQLSLKHGNGSKFVEAFANYMIELGDEIILSIDPDAKKVVVSEYAKKFTTRSRGLNWYNIQTSIAKSQRRNWGMTDEEKQAIAKSNCDGEIVGGWDGISGEDMAAKGLAITNDGYFETNEKYEGWALRVGMGFEFEYDYGMKSISEGCLMFLWINRRVSAENVVDIDPR